MKAVTLKMVCDITITIIIMMITDAGGDVNDAGGGDGGAAGGDGDADVGDVHANDAGG